MGWTSKLGHWLDIRPNEGRSVALSVLGAFLLLAALTLARSLREALYLDRFAVDTLPYLTIAVVALSLPLVAVFTRLLGRSSPRRVVLAFGLVQAAGLIPLWLIVRIAPHSGPAIVAFYLWTTVGLMTLASGFWLVTADSFSVRGAKRLFGLISAGGTAGAMVTGISLSRITREVSPGDLFPALVILILLLLLSQQLLPEGNGSVRSQWEEDRDGSIGESIALIRRTKHLRTIAMIAMTATIASVIVDYQFKEHVQAAWGATPDATARMSGFFGAFYGWTGAVALGIQLLVAGRLVGRFGIGPALAVLPALLLLGSAGFALLPGLLVVTLTRGADASLRKSLFRPTMEFLYVPLAEGVRNRTKTFLDAFADSLAEALGAGIVLLWVTLLALPSRGLSAFVMLLALVLIGLSRRMDREYLRTIVTRLQQEEPKASVLRGRFDGDELLSASFARLDVRAVLAASGGEQASDGSEPVGSTGSGLSASSAASARLAGEATSAADVKGLPSEKRGGSQHAGGAVAQLRSSNNQRVLAAIDEIEEWDEEAIAALIALLARDEILREVVVRLASLGGLAVPQLSSILVDEGADFVLRRRIPQVLSRTGGSEADDALLGGVRSRRFEVRYRSAIALLRRRRKQLPLSKGDWKATIWEAVETEVTRERPLWELQKLFDDQGEGGQDDLVGARVGVRGALSLEHTFRMLTLVLDPEPVRASFHGITLEDETLKGFAQEYLERVLPLRIRERLWFLIGDLSDRQRERDRRPVDEVVSDLMSSRATLFGGEVSRAALRRLVDEREEERE